MTGLCSHECHIQRKRRIDIYSSDCRGRNAQPLPWGNQEEGTADRHRGQWVPFLPSSGPTPAPHPSPAPRDRKRRRPAYQWVPIFCYFFWYGPFLKFSLNLLQYCFWFMFWFVDHQACRISAPRPRIEPTPTSLEALILNHWTTREVPGSNSCTHTQTCS